MARDVRRSKRQREGTIPRGWARSGSGLQFRDNPHHVSTDGRVYLDRMPDLTTLGYTIVL
ncbi:MAG TPA: hypothetical protein VER58_20565 [Thermoanaerobaculia bacterium]|nr:hypothetical protein [Thermoanaerobaculia bacterium]